MPAVNRVLASAVALAALAAVAGCAAPRSPNPELPALRVAARLDLENLCREGVSPPVAIQNPAAGTASYTLRFTNLSVLIQTPRQFTIPAPADPRRIPAGAMPDYEGPCPGDLQIFRYRIEVLARGVAGDGLAYGQTISSVRSVNKTAQQQWRQAGRTRPELEAGIDDNQADAVFDDVFSQSVDGSFDPFASGRSRRNDLYVPR